MRLYINSFCEFRETAQLVSGSHVPCAHETWSSEGVVSALISYQLQYHLRFSLVSGRTQRGAKGQTGTVDTQALGAAMLALGFPSSESEAPVIGGVFGLEEW